jgi:hypothetical protein
VEENMSLKFVTFQIGQLQKVLEIIIFIR